MKKNLFVLVGQLLSLTSLAQGVTQLPDISVYQGNPYSLTLTLPAADSALSTSAILYVTKASRAVESALQPSVTRSGRRAIISWSGAQSSKLNPVTWLELSAGSLIRYQAWVYTSKAPVSTTSPNSLTVVSPVLTMTVGGVVGLQAVLDTKQNALGYSPYNSTNPAGYQTASQVQAAGDGRYASRSRLDSIVARTNTLDNNINASQQKLSALTEGPMSYTLTQANRDVGQDNQISTNQASYAIDKANLMLSIGQKASQSALDATNALVSQKQDAASAEPGVLKFNTYALAIAGLAGRTKPCRVLIMNDEVNNAGKFGKYDYDGTTLIEDVL